MSKLTYMALWFKVFVSNYIPDTNKNPYPILGAQSLALGDFSLDFLGLGTDTASLWIALPQSSKDCGKPCISYR